MVLTLRLLLAVAIFVGGIPLAIHLGFENIFAKLAYGIAWGVLAVGVIIVPVKTVGRFLYRLLVPHDYNPLCEDPTPVPVEVDTDGNV